tara:strand:- start:1532 stop:2293 length:762 start_codon:yes stop_codon:yes gene_type:complete
VARTWTVKTAKTRDQFKAEHFNEPANAVASQFNGKLDQHNMPLDSVMHADLADPVYGANAFSVQTKSSYMPTQSYHTAVWDIDSTAGLDTTEFGTAVYTTNFSSDNWNAKWNSFPASPVSQGSRVKFNAQEGMIYGGVTASVERRSGRARNQYGQGGNVGAEFNIGQSNWHELGVFVNGILCGRSGELNNGSYTVDIPFSTPIGTEFVSIEVKWMADQLVFKDGSVASGTATNDAYQQYICSGIFLWARNQFR